MDWNESEHLTTKWLFFNHSTNRLDKLKSYRDCMVFLSLVLYFPDEFVIGFPREHLNILIKSQIWFTTKETEFERHLIFYTRSSEKKEREKCVEFFHRFDPVNRDPVLRIRDLSNRACSPVASFY